MPSLYLYLYPFHLNVETIDDCALLPVPLQDASNLQGGLVRN